MRCCPKEWMKFFKAAHDENRQKILRMLREKGSLTAGEIVKKMKLSQPTVSHHLKILCEAEIVKAEKKQREVHYSLAKDNIASCCTGFMKYFSHDCKTK